MRGVSELYSGEGSISKASASTFAKRSTENMRTRNEISVTSLLDFQQLDVEGEGGVSGDTRNTFAAVGEVCGNGESALATDIPATPMSHPLITSPAPSLNEKGLPFLFAKISSAYGSRQEVL